MYQEPLGKEDIGGPTGSPCMSLYGFISILQIEKLRLKSIQLERGRAVW